MPAKTDILENLGETALLLPRLINQALTANDRVKYLVDPVQSAQITPIVQGWTSWPSAPLMGGYGSWLNLVERWFAELTNKQLRRGVMVLTRHFRLIAQCRPAECREFFRRLSDESGRDRQALNACLITE